MSIRLWGTGHAYYLYYASYENNSVGSMNKQMMIGTFLRLKKTHLQRK
jgi:hypothetical protein